MFPVLLEPSATPSDTRRGLGPTRLSGCLPMQARVILAKS
jgi:hypothetical protein